MIENMPLIPVSAFMDDFNTISIYFSYPIDILNAQKIVFIKNNKVKDFSIRKVIDNLIVINTERLKIKELYHIYFEESKVEVIPHKVLDSFYYRGDDLGLSCTKDKSIFKVFAPSATKLIVNIYKKLNDAKGQIYEMTEKDGVWSVNINGDLSGRFYNYNVYGNLNVFDEKRFVIDIYAKCVIGKTGKALIIDESEYEQECKSTFSINKEKLIISEIHLRDMTIDKSSGVKNKGKYLSLNENDTFLNSDKNSKITTSINHLKELGINTLQIMPLQDFENDESKNEYNWGYMPRFFNTPDGVYASNPFDDTKIKELKKVINGLHQNHFKVVLDVVYNHTSEGFTGNTVYSFNGFVPYFYYRIGGNGHVSNGSGCGNELRTESPMVRKFIIESLKYWVNFYNVDGFRFDLMGLIDKDSLCLIVKELKEIKSDIIIYGEPWTSGMTPITPSYKGIQRDLDLSVFNDDFRDAVKGSVFDIKDKGYIQSKGAYYLDKTISGISGSIDTFAGNALESFNYVEIHDNNTLFDKLYFSLTENEKFIEPDDNILKEIISLQKLAGFILLTSRGIPVLHLGMDLLRTKKGNSNSYDKGDIINKIDWNRKKEFHNVFLYYKALIDIRKSHPILTISEKDTIMKATLFRNDIFPIEYRNGISYTLNNNNLFENEFSEIMILINPYPVKLALQNLDFNWKVLIDDKMYFDKTNDNIKFSNEIDSQTGIILYKK